jgi:hypothetical protein
MDRFTELLNKHIELANGVLSSTPMTHDTDKRADLVRMKVSPSILHSVERSLIARISSSYKNNIAATEATKANRIFPVLSYQIKSGGIVNDFLLSVMCDTAFGDCLQERRGWSPKFNRTFLGFNTLSRCHTLLLYLPVDVFINW